jgi:hypothetical protein
MFTFSELRLSDPVLFGIVYALLFSVTKPLGEVLVGVAFWMVARNLKHSKVRIFDYFSVRDDVIICFKSTNFFSLGPASSIWTFYH